MGNDKETCSVNHGKANVLKKLIVHLHNVLNKSVEILRISIYNESIKVNFIVLGLFD